MKMKKATAKKATKKSSAKKSAEYGVDESKLMKLFEDELKDIYWAEQALTKALPKMSKNATSPKLVKAIDSHLKETHGQIKKLEQVFSIIGKKPQAKKCEAMAGLVKEGGEIIKDTDKGGMRDAGIISACQKVEHYEIASYGTLRTFATVLGLQDAAYLLESILEEEKSADQSLTEIAEATINVQALEEQK